MSKSDKTFLVKPNQLTEKRDGGYLRAFQELLDQIDEGIDKLESYERTMQVKRSIDRLIETLYSQATNEDIAVELETIKHIPESIHRVREKRKKRIIEQTILAQKQKEKEQEIKETITNVDGIKKQIKSSIKDVLFSVIANRMDPKKRAGETTDSNQEHAQLYGRKAARGLLGKVFLTAINALIHGLHDTSFAKHVEESRNTDQQNGLKL